MKQTLKLSWVLIALLAITVISSCKKDKDDDDTKVVTAGFSYSIDATNPLLVTFTNTSTNFTSLSWDFGDNTTSTETNPSHTYAAAGTFQVKLTATGASGSDNITIPVVLVNANEMKDILTGTDGAGKTWKLLRDVSGGRYPLQVGPDTRIQIWWAMGLNNNELALRPCMLNDEWKFTEDGEMIFDAKGDFWAEFGVYDTAFDNTCHSTDDMLGVNGDDLSAWGNGTHTFELSEGMLTVTGQGAFLGLSKVATDAEVTLPQDHVTYEIIKLTEGSTDSLIIETAYMADAGVTPAYWRFVLVHYDNPDDEPSLDILAAAFTMEQNGSTITLTNTSSGANSYSWDFGDGTTSTEVSPTHTYLTDGVFDVVLTANSSTATAEMRMTVILLSDAIITAEDIQGDAWKIRLGARAIFVGPAFGSSEWYSVPYAFLIGEGTGPDDWSCIMDDEFIFSAGGVYEYKTNGSGRNDGYMGTPNGCWTDAEIAASGNGAAFGSAVHSFEVTTGPWGRSNIVLTNGATGAAFIGFYKGYYGGENNGTNPPNGGLTTNTYEVLGYFNLGTKEYLFLSVDLLPEHSGLNSWSVILER